MNFGICWYLPGELHAVGQWFQHSIMGEWMSKYKAIALVITLAIFVQNSAVAGAAFKINPMQSSITGVISQKAKSRGFAANDPRYLQTISAVNGTLAAEVGGVAAAVTVGAITAPAWVTIAVGIGVGAVVTYGVSLALGGLTNWIFPPTSSTQSLQYIAAPTTATGGVTAGSPAWIDAANDNVRFYSSDPLSPLYATFNYLNYAAQGYVIDSCNQESPIFYKCYIAKMVNGSSSVQFAMGSNYDTSGAPITCPKGQLAQNNVCIGVVVPASAPNTSSPPVTLTPQAAVNQIMQSDEVNKPLNPAVVAMVADKLWRDTAAKPGYSGIPYDATDPITTDDATTYKNANPSNYPTVGDFVTPQDPATTPFVLPVTPNQTTEPVANPANSVNAASSQPQTNLGDDPAIGSPTLEDTPTASMILTPIFSLFTDFKNFAVPSHSAECPKPVLQVFNKSITMDAQCTLAEQQRSTLLAVMAVVWLLAGALIVLRA